MMKERKLSTKSDVRTDSIGDDPELSLVDRVVIIARERILNGEYEPGARINSNQLAKEAGVSVIPVREALRVLEADRLVVTAPNKGARVADLSIEDMRDLYETRILLESAVLRTAQPLSRRTAANLRQTLVHMREAKERDDRDRFLILHREFHFALYAQATSNWQFYLIEILWNHTERYQRLSIPIRHEGAETEHRRVLDALEKGDNQAASDAIRIHLETTARLVEDGYRVGTEPRTAEAQNPPTPKPYLLERASGTRQ